MHDLHTKISEKVALNIAAITTNTTTNGASVERTGSESLEFVIQSGVLTDGAYAVNVQHSDDGSVWADAVAADDLLGAEPSFAATDDNVVKSVGYIGGKKFARIQIVSTGVTTGGTLGAVAVLDHALHQPV